MKPRFQSRLAAATLLLIVVSITGVGQMIGQLETLDFTAVEQEAYWYSRYNLGHLTMRAGMGEIFMPESEMVEAMIAIADANPEDGDTVSPPLNPALLRTVYAGGDPLWIQSADPADFATLRWDPASFDTRVTGAAMGWTIVKELEWAKQFHIDSHFGTPESNFGAQWRFMGLVLTAMARMQAMEWMTMHAAESISLEDDADPFVMLMALSNLADLVGEERLHHSESNRYYDPEASAIFLAAADTLFDEVRLIQSHRFSVKELSIAIQGLVWYAATTLDSVRQYEAFERIDELGEELLDVRTRTAAEKGYALRGLVELLRVRDEDEAHNEIIRLVSALEFEFDEEYGVFSSQDTYSIDDIAAIVGGLNAVRLHIEERTQRAETLLVGFFEAAVNLSGLQQSVPPVTSGKGAFELGAPAIHYGYPGLPLPGEVGVYGVAPVFATEVQFDRESQAWTVTDASFDTAGAMHAANEFIWLHASQVNGFPEVERISDPATSLLGRITLGGIMLRLVFILVATTFVSLLVRK